MLRNVFSGNSVNVAGWVAPRWWLIKWFHWGFSQWIFWVALNKAAWISTKSRPTVAAAFFFFFKKPPILDMIALSVLLGLKWYLLDQFSLDEFLFCISVLYLNHCPFLKAGIWKLRSQELTVVFYAFCDIIPSLGNSVECLKRRSFRAQLKCPFIQNLPQSPQSIYCASMIPLCLQTLPNRPGGQKSLLVENRCLRGI